MQIHFFYLVVSNKKIKKRVSFGEHILSSFVLQSFQKESKTLVVFVKTYRSINEMCKIKTSYFF